MTVHIDPTKPTLYVTMGLPASGKTYFSQQLAAEQDIFFLNCDNLRLAMYEQPAFDAAESKIVYGAVTFIADQHLAQGKSIVCNGNYHVRGNRDVMQSVAQKHNANYCILWTKTPYDVAKERIQSRDHEIPVEKMVHPPLELLERMSRAHEEPSADEPVISIDGTLPYEKQREVYKEMGGI
jgi:predicted kinase